MTGENPDVGILDTAHAIEDVRFIHRSEMQGMTISPDVLKTTFWDDLADGFPSTRYLGVRKSAYLGSCGVLKSEAWGGRARRVGGCDVSDVFPFVILS